VGHPRGVGKNNAKNLHGRGSTSRITTIFCIQHANEGNVFSKVYMYLLKTISRGRQKSLEARCEIVGRYILH